ncbi:hypothetical protein Unana1_03738 [Umbelopsis nana]
MSPLTVSDSDNVVLPFGKQLAANEKKTRDKAVRSLQQFLSSKAELSEKDLLKLWKGLFYCFWMSDKPLIQQSLSETLGSLVMSLQQQNAIAFIGAFWQIHCEEWHGIDRLRLDKYYMLLRRVIFYTFKYISEHDWDLGIIDDYSELLKNGPLHPTNKKIPDSIRYHLSDIYLGELEKVVNAQLNSLAEEDDIEIPTTELLDAFTNLLAKTPNKITAKKVSDNIFIPILEQFASELLHFENQMQKEKSEEDDDDENDERPPFIYDVDTLEKALGHAAEDPETYGPNKKKLAELQRRFKELIPGEEGSEESNNSDDDEAPALVDAMEENEELEELDEDEEDAKRSGWKNEFTAADIIADELKDEPKSKDKGRKPKKDNGLLGGKMVSIDASTLDISGLETSTTTEEEAKPKNKKKAKKAKEVEEEPAVEEEVEEEVIEEETEVVTSDEEDKDAEDAEVTAHVMKKKKKSVQWVLDKNTIRRFQKQRPITSVATAVEPKVSQPIKSAIKAAAAAAVVPSDGKVNGGSNGQLKKKRKTAATKNGDAKRKKATDFF